MLSIIVLNVMAPRKIKLTSQELGSVQASLEVFL
jgi:hypothetical protein